MKQSNIRKAVIFIPALFFIAMIIVSSFVQAFTYRDAFEPSKYCLRTWTQSITFTSPILIENHNNIVIKIDGTNMYTQIPGQPSIPYKSLVASLPFGTKIHDVRCTPSKIQVISLEKPIESVPSFTWYCNNDAPLDRLITDFKENTKSWYSYHVGGGIANELHKTFLSIHVYPIRYDEEKMILEYIDEMTIHVSYEVPTIPMHSNDIYSLVILSPAKFQLPLQKLVTHKIKNGIQTKLVTLNEIYSDKYFMIEGYDEAEQIKYFIKNAMEQWGSTYFLLVGSIYELPMRAAWFGEYELLTDMYYADVYFANGSFCDWDSNGNHVYGEYWHKDQKDSVDLYSDVYLGRLACNNLFEVYVVVNKIVNYESRAQDEWWDKIILLGGDTFPGWGVYEGEVTNECIAEVLHTLNKVKLWTSENRFTVENINSEVTKGARFLEYSGHGYTHGMGTSPPNQPDRIEYTIADLLKVFNGYKLPVVFFDACLTAKLDATLGELLGHPRILKVPSPVYGWYWVKKIGGGSIAVIGATEVAYSSVNANGPQAGAGCLSLHFFEGYQSCETVAEMLVYSQNYYLNNLWKDHWTIEQFVLLGDPTLMVGGSSE